MKVRHINYGNTDRFHNLANLDLLKDGGKPLVSPNTQAWGRRKDVKVFGCSDDWR